MADAPPQESPTDDIPYWPPKYKQRKWAPNKLQRFELRGLALGHAFLRDNKALNKTADEYFLANALVEGPMRNFGLNIKEDFSDYQFDQRHKELAVHCAPGMGYRKNADEMQRAIGCGYGMMFDFKTGSYADGVYKRRGKGPPTATQRIELWNGVGKSYHGADYGKLAGKLYGDASNHARKVMEMQKVLSAPENAEFIKLYRKLGGYYSGKTLE